MKTLALVLVLLLPGCAHHPHDHESRNRISDPAPDRTVCGVTYDQGIRHPTVWERVFWKLGIN